MYFINISWRKKKSFVVYNGRKIGLYTSLIYCYAQANGYTDSVVRLYDIICMLFFIRYPKTIDILEGRKLIREGKINVYSFSAYIPEISKVKKKKLCHNMRLF
jgi:hypothetical protein